MDTDAGQRPEWRHLLPITGLGEERVEASRPLRVTVDVERNLAPTLGVQHLTWLLVTLLTRGTRVVIASVGVDVGDVPLHPGVDPASPKGGPSFEAALRSAADIFGPEAAPVVDRYDSDRADLVLQIGAASRERSKTAVLYVAASSWTGAVSPDATDLQQFDFDANPIGAHVAACLAAGQAYMLARVRDHQVAPVALNAWTLAQVTEGLAEVAGDDPGELEVELDHVLAGAGAVGSALLLTLWAYRNASGKVQTADADEKGVDVTNLNRCVPFQWADRGRPKAEVAAERLGARPGLIVEPTVGRAQGLVGAHTHLISAVDTPEARQALQDRYSASAVQASTSGLRLELLRVDPTVGTACLRCFNRPRAATPDAEVRARVSDMDDATVDAHAAAVGTSSFNLREWGRVGGCGQIGDAILDRLRASDGGAAQFSVGFMSVLAGTLLAAQVIKDSARRSGQLSALAGQVPLLGASSRFVSNLLDPANMLVGVRRYGQDPDCPSCHGVRADIWTRRWKG